MIGSILFTQLRVSVSKRAYKLICYSEQHFRRRTERPVQVPFSSLCSISKYNDIARQVGLRLFTSCSICDDTGKPKERICKDLETQTWTNHLHQSFSEECVTTNPQTSKRLETVDCISPVGERIVATNQAVSEEEIEDFGDYEEEREILVPQVQEKHIPISLERGKTGVFDVDEVITVLESQNGVDVRTIDISPEICFVDHMVLVSGKSLRHMRAMAASIEWLYKQKQRKNDRQFKMEGRDCKDWIAMDLGNIALHIFTPAARQHYDLETLWTLGPEFDDKRHYIQDGLVNISSEDLLWLENGWKDSALSQARQDSVSENVESSKVDASQKQEA